MIAKTCRDLLETKNTIFDRLCIDIMTIDARTEQKCAGTRAIIRFGVNKSCQIFASDEAAHSERGIDAPAGAVEPDDFNLRMSRIIDELFKGKFISVDNRSAQEGRIALSGHGEGE